MNFRRWITALAVLALFAGFASAQVANSGAGSGALQCAASVAVPPTLRSEGLTELVGDIVLTCTGGPTPTIGTVIPTANFTVSFGTNVTSRLLTYAYVNTAPTLAQTNTSEALLMIDEPGSGLSIGPPGYLGAQTNIGPGAPQTLCATSAGGSTPASLVGAGAPQANGGCQEYVWNNLTPGSDYVASMSPSVYSAPANLFAGVVQSNQVTFYGIPILPPTSPGVARIFRMTNIRINANALGGGGLAGTTQVLASVSISGPTSVPVNNPVQIAGFVQSGLSTSFRNVGNAGTQGAQNQNQCSSPNLGAIGLFRFTENFGTAFKTRGVTGQNVPGAIYNTESGFVSSLVGGTQYGYTAGLADFGTRLKAVFSNVPTGVRIFVSTTNVVNLTNLVAPITTTSYAALVLNESTPDSGLGAPILPLVPASGYTNFSNSTSPVNGYAELQVVNNSATAVWEVVQTNPATPENFDFGFWITYSGNPGANSPPPGTAAVNLSFAPTATQGAFTAAAGAAVSGTLPIPRFADTSTATNVFTIVTCTTSLLFPFVTNQGGFDTGLALMNTSTDPFGTKPQAGTCALNFYGQNAPPQYVTASIPSGNNTASTTYAFLASSIAPNFQGYVVALCQFQLAHGYAFISDLGAQKLAHGYLALVLNGGTSSRPSSTGVPSGTTEALEN